MISQFLQKIQIHPTYMNKLQPTSCKTIEMNNNNNNNKLKTSKERNK